MEIVAETLFEPSRTRGKCDKNERRREP